MIYRTDRDRRMAGDTVLIRREHFAAVHPTVIEVLDIFAERHAELDTILDGLRKEAGEDQQARSFREQIQAQAISLYEWGYGQLDALLTPSWEDPAERVSVDEVRDRLFPLGSPGKVTTSSQKLFDGLEHLKKALAREPVVFPQRFIKALAEKTPALGDAIAKVVKENTETNKQQVLVNQARQRWDDAYTSLKEVTSAFLRLDGRREEMGSLFKVNLTPPEKQSAADEEEDAPAEAQSDAPQEEPAPQEEA